MINTRLVNLIFLFDYEIQKINYSNTTENTTNKTVFNLTPNGIRSPDATNGYKYTASLTQICACMEIFRLWTQPCLLVCFE